MHVLVLTYINFNIMKKLNPTYEELLASHLKPFEAKIDGCKTKGIIFVENENIFLMQNSALGKTPNNNNWRNYGYIRSWFYKCDNITSSLVENLSIEIEEEWKPKLGELVFIPEIKENRIFLFEKDGEFACVSVGENEYFKKNYSFNASFWETIRKIEEPKPIEISLEEAKQIIAESKNTTPDKINLNFKIN